jgi:hypothetical protein
MQAAPSASAQGSAALAAECLGAFQGQKLDASTRIIAGTSTKIYELTGTTWGDVTRSSGGNYNLGTNRWSFCQFGDYTLAANLATVLQASASSNFANVSGGPQAAIIEDVLTSGGGFVFAANLSTNADAWICSALNDHTSWTPSTATQCTTGRLISGDGPIIAGRRFGTEQIVLYKQRSMFVGFYVGVEGGTWRFREIPKIGCVGLDAVANLGNYHVFVAPDDIYVFDGNQPVSIAQGVVRDYFVASLNSQQSHRTIVRYDEDRQLVWIFYPDQSSSGQPNATLVWSPTTRQWGKSDRSVEAVLFYAPGIVTFDTDTGTFDESTDTFDSDTSGTRALSIIDSTHTMQLLTGAALDSSFTLHDIGSASAVTSIVELRLQYETLPTAASVTTTKSMQAGAAFTTGTTVSAADIPSGALNRFNPRQTSRWHRSRFDFAGPPAVIGYEAQLRQVGRR